jgi:hypothetical protein
MKFKPWSLAIASIILVSGCGAAPTAPVAVQAESPDAQANLLAKLTTSAAWSDREGVAYVKFGGTPIVGQAIEEHDVHYSTDGGKTAAISKLLLGRDGHLYIKRPTKEPRVYTYHRVGTYENEGLKNGAKLDYKLDKGAKAKYRKGIPVPMLDYSYILIVLPALPAAEKGEPAWAKF